MFATNKYTTTYYLIVDRAKRENRTKKGEIYYESHHIIPKSLGGSNLASNKVLLTFKEHYVCHRLLTKMVTDPKHRNKMMYALFVLSRTSDGQMRELTHHQRMKCLSSNREASRNRNHKPNLGNKHSEETKRLLREKSTGQRHTDETKEKISKNNQLTNKSRAEKVGNFWAGKPKTEEQRRKISETLKKRNLERKMVAKVGIEPTTSSV